MHRRTLKFLLCASLIHAGAFPGFGQESPPEIAADEEGTGGGVPLVVALFPESGKPTQEDKTLRANLEPRLKEQLEPFLSGTPYGPVRVQVSATWDQAAAHLRRGNSTVIECDPVLYYSTALSREGVAGRYRVVLQRIATNLPRARVVALKDSGLERTPDLRGSRIGFVHRIAGGGAQVQRILNDLGLSANRDYQVWNAGYVENAFLNFKAGLVDAIVVPDGAAMQYQSRHNFPPTHTVLVTNECLPPLFAVRRDDAESYPALVKALSEELRSFFGPENLVEAKDDFYETTRREGMLWEGF